MRIYTFCLLFLLTILGKQAASAQQAENDTIDVNDCGGTVNLRLGVLANDIYSCDAPSIKVLSSSQAGATLSYSADSIFYVRTVDYTVFGRTDSILYSLTCNGRSDTATVYFNYALPSIKIVNRYSKNCFQTGDTIVHTIELHNTCGNARNIGIDFLIENTRIDYTPLDARPLTLNAASVISSGYSDELRRIVLNMQPGGRATLEGRLIINSVQEGAFPAGNYVGYVFDSNTGRILQLNGQETFNLCPDRQAVITDCDSLHFDLSQHNAIAYRIVSKKQAGSTVVISPEGQFTYFAADTKGAIDSDSIMYEISYSDGSTQEGLISLQILPCIRQADATSTANDHCNTEPCNYTGPSILINEVITTPAEYNGAIYGRQCYELETQGGGEWVELYNPDPCNAVDISGYFFGNSTIDDPHCNGDLNVRDIGASFVLPEGTVVPPSGFCILRGEFAAHTDTARLVENGGNTVEINLMEHFDRFCLDDTGYRFWLPDVGGWFGFYNREGVPQDAIYWGAETEDICADCTPCNPQFAGTYQGELASLDGFPAERKNRIRDTYTDDFVGVTAQRIPDGGAWVLNGQFEATEGYCNDNCNIRSSDNCNGTATVVAAGGTNNFSYLWNDPKGQTTATATGLCEGTYCCTITDNVTGIQTLACAVVVTEDAIADTIWLADSVCSNELPYRFYDQSISNTGEYTHIPHCDSVFVLQLTVLDSVATSQEVSICAGETYPFAGKILTGSGSYFDYQTAANGCDSVVCLLLTVLPEAPDNYRELSIGEGDSILFAGKILKETGIYYDTLSTAKGCDSLLILNLTVIDSLDYFPQENIPEGFSPNDDGLNDRFVIRDIEFFPNNSLLIFNRWGNKVYEGKPYMNDWDGRNYAGGHIGDNLLPVGTYFYILDLGNDTRARKGFIYLNR